MQKIKQGEGVILLKEPGKINNGKMTDGNKYDPQWARLEPELVEEIIEDYVGNFCWSPNMIMQLGVEYEGDNFDTIRHGPGKLTTVNESGKRVTLYEGFFLCGAIHSPYADLYDHKGEIEFRGEVFGGRKIAGKEYHYNGELRYQGEFKLEKPHGTNCILYDAHGKVEYQGELINGEVKKPFDYEVWKKKKANDKEDLHQHKKKMMHVREAWKEHKDEQKKE